MANQREYAGAIWTNHALDRLDQRGLSQVMAGQTFLYSDSYKSVKEGGTEFTKKFDISTVTVIAKKSDQGEWLILSCWIEPPLPGSIDIGKKEKYLKERDEYRKGGFWKRFWIDFKKAVEW